MMDANTARGASSPANPACGAGPKRGAGEVSPSQHAGPQTRRKHPAGGASLVLPEEGGGRGAREAPPPREGEGRARARGGGGAAGARGGAQGQAGE